MLVLNLTGQFGGYCNIVVSGDDTGEISASNGGMAHIVEDYERISRLERFGLEQVGYLLPAPAAARKPWRFCPTPLLLRSF
tara:strand:+ start:41 stop:283 length:243 start_codon:yes stop_codon:yes gene_type:complete